MSNFIAHVGATLGMYKDATTRATKLTGRNVLVLFTVPAYAVMASAAGTIAPAFGILGGFMVAIVRDLLASSFLHMVAIIVSGQKVDFEDFKKSFVVYFWEILSFFFVIFLFELMLMPALRSHPNGGVISMLIYLVAFIVLNAVPELIYQGRHGTLELFGEAIGFIHRNWPEWLIPNIILGAALAGLWTVLPRYVDALICSLFLYFVMVFRGLVFQELNSGSRRMRMFRAKMRD